MTWDDLLVEIARLTPEQRKQPVQVVLPTYDDDVQTCQQGIALDTVANYEFGKCRSVHNNRYCPDDVVLLLDGNPFHADGSYAHEYDFETKSWLPVYRDGATPTPIAAQCSPQTLKELEDERRT